MTRAATRFSLDRLGSIVGPWRGVLGYALFTLIVLVVCLAFALPHELILARVLAEATTELPVRIVPGEVAFSFPNGYRLEKVRVSHREDPSLSAEIAEITVSTPILGILLGQVDSADFSGTMYDGSFEGNVTTAGGRVTTNLVLEDVSLAKVSRRLLPPPGAIGGSASLSLQLAGDGRNAKTNEGKVELRAKGVSLEGIVAQGFTVPDLSFTTVDLDAALEGSRLQIESSKAAGEEVTLSATGNVLVRDPAPRSVLNLQIEIDVSPDARPGLRVATSLLPPKKAGQESWALRGSIAAPSIR